tara:strand:- start:243 stop:587 length:345 start_codon:yes stop_codon:yes gene_type:complete
MAFYLKVDIMTLLEDNFDCSGICESSLFYFSKSTLDGYPKDTCLEKMVKYIQISLVGIVPVTRFGAIVLLFLFVLHFTFYGKDMKEEETNSDYGNFPDRPTDTTVKKIPAELEI